MTPNASHREEITLEFAGPDASGDAQAFAEFLKELLPDCPTTITSRETTSPAGADGTRDPALIVAVIAVMFAVPSGIKDGLELADRLRLRGRLTKLIAWAKARRARRQQNPFVALPPHGVKVPLDQADPDQLLDGLSQPAHKQEPPTP